MPPNPTKPRILQSGTARKSEMETRQSRRPRDPRRHSPWHTRCPAPHGAIGRHSSGTSEQPYIDPYDNSALLDTLDRLDTLDASGGADLYKGLRTVNGLPQRPTSLLLITDGLPTAPAKGNQLTEKDRVALFNLALATPLSFPVNVFIFPFEGDPSAAGLYWKLSTRTGGITLVPDDNWPLPPSHDPST